MHAVLQQQLSWHQSYHAASLSTDIYQTVVNPEVVYKVILQWWAAGLRPSRKAVGLVVVDVHTAKRTYQQCVVGQQSQARQELM